jgi:hypothetical protein
VSGDYVRDLRALGYADLTADQIVSLRIHGVTGEFIRQANAGGQRRRPVDELVRLRIGG